MSKVESKKWPRWAKILIVVAIVAAVALGAVAGRYLASVNGFLNKVTDWGKETKSYSVVVRYESGDDLQVLASGNVGFLKSDAQAGVAKAYLDEQVAGLVAGWYEDVDTLMGALENDIVDGVVMETGRLEELKEVAEEASKAGSAASATAAGAATAERMAGTRVLYTFEIENEVTEAKEEKTVTEPFVVYISGTDSRAGVKATARSDVNIVAAVNPETGKILLVSIPRDAYVQLHGTTGLKDKLTHAGIYGVDMSRATIEDLLGVKIDYTVKASFATVVELVDALDGIEINSDQEMSLKAEGKDKVCEFKVGAQTVDGDCALRFARERKSYETGDRHRGENQQQVITGVIGKLSQSKDYVLKLPEILDAAADTFETSLGREKIMDLVRMQLEQKIRWQVKSIAVDGTGANEPTYSMGANLPLYVLLPDESTVTRATEMVNEYLTK